LTVEAGTPVALLVSGARLSVFQQHAADILLATVAILAPIGVRARITGCQQRRAHTAELNTGLS
jgi:hypothetical protein